MIGGEKEGMKKGVEGVEKGGCGLFEGVEKRNGGLRGNRDFVV